jgi:hypothetical protein
VPHTVGLLRPCAVALGGGALVLRWQATPLVAASAWVPAARPPPIDEGCRGAVGVQTRTRLRPGRPGNASTYDDYDEHVGGEDDRGASSDETGGVPRSLSSPRRVYGATAVAALRIASVRNASCSAGGLNSTYSTSSSTAIVWPGGR